MGSWKHHLEALRIFPQFDVWHITRSTTVSMARHLIHWCLRCSGFHSRWISSRHFLQSLVHLQPTILFPSQQSQPQYRRLEGHTFIKPLERFQWTSNIATFRTGPFCFTTMQSRLPDLHLGKVELPMIIQKFWCHPHHLPKSLTRLTKNSTSLQNFGVWEVHRLSQA